MVVKSNRTLAEGETAGSNMLLLSLTIGEYSDVSYTILAASNDKAKLEAKRDKYLADARLRVKVYDDAQNEYKRLLGENPFIELPPPNRLPRPNKELRTKEEQEERRQAKLGLEKAYLEWANRKSSHEDSIWHSALNTALKANGVMNDYGYHRYIGPDYYYRHMDEGNFDIFEVEEL